MPAVPKDSYGFPNIIFHFQRFVAIPEDSQESSKIGKILTNFR